MGASLISPVRILEAQNEHEIFKIQERDLLLHAALNLEWDIMTGSDVEAEFYRLLKERVDLQNYLWADLDNENIKDTTVKDFENLKSFLGSMYEFSKTDSSLTLTRRNLKKRYELRANSAKSFSTNVILTLDNSITIQKAELEEYKI